MTISEYAETYSWKGAIELGPRLLSLADELPASETMGLSLQLHQLAVELPASIAASLVANKSADLGVMLKLIAVLELIDRVYPALDVAPVRRQADELAERLAGDDFDAAPQPTIALPAELDSGDGQTAELGEPSGPSGSGDPAPAAPETPAPTTHIQPDAVDGVAGPSAPNNFIQIQPGAPQPQPTYEDLNVYPDRQ